MTYIFRAFIAEMLRIMMNRGVERQTKIEQENGRSDECCHWTMEKIEQEPEKDIMEGKFVHQHLVKTLVLYS